MFTLHFSRFTGAALLLLCGLVANAQQKAIGTFEGQTDVGTVQHAGSATYQPKNNQYTISGSGQNIWGSHDDFHFVWKKMKGDFLLYTRASFIGKGVEAHRKIGWMVRKSLESGSPEINAAVHGDGLTSLQYRRTAGAETEEQRSKTDHADVIQLERTGNTFTMRVARFGEPFVTEQTSNVDLGDEVYVGLFVCAHNPNVTESGTFNNVSITIPYKGVANQSTQMTLGSNVELLDIATGNRETIYKVAHSIQAPNWTPDGKTLIYNDANGLVYRFNLTTRTPELLNTGEVKHNNNDHVLSFGGRMLGLSSFENQLGGSIIYTVPVTGGTPRQITPRGPSYLHGWSPDGKSLVFCGERNGNFDVYKVAVTGGPEQRLTDAAGLDDGPEYTPDSKFIYFNSVRSGLMQIWRMHPDGSGQEQVTHDDFNNWFAHISPDGKYFVFLSFLKDEVEPGIHPPYKHIYIRLLPISGQGTPKVLAYVYGGQGSINTPSWSPDGKRIAFISNSDMSGEK